MSDAPSIRQLVEQCNEGLRRMTEANEALAEAICGALRPIVGNLEWTLEWAGPDVICLGAEGRYASQRPGWRREVSLCRLVREAFDEAGLSIDVDAPFGLYVTQEEAQRVREALRRLLGINGKEASKA